MRFEFDPRKSANNKLKHGIDFIEAQSLWAVRAVVLKSDRSSEVRYARIATQADGKLWTAIYTHRDENGRIISVRPASRGDRRIYEENIS
jgi:uncharacterized DUF497 family protein